MKKTIARKPNTTWMKGGVITALITPFDEDGVFDPTRFRMQIERQISAGVAGIVVMGTTGESPTLSHEEHHAVIREAVKIAAGRISVIAGTGSNHTKEAISLTREAERAGADALLQVVPYYNKPPQEGLFQHFGEIAHSTNLPIMLYDIPGRCGVSIHNDTIVKLAKACRNIRALKEASGRPERTAELHGLLGKRFLVFSGDDALTIPFIGHGAVGVVSVLSNLTPHLLKRFIEEIGRWVKFPRDIARFNESLRVGTGRYSEWMAMVEFIPLLFGEYGNPAGIKSAMHSCDLDSGLLRSPLAPPSDQQWVLIGDAARSLYHYENMSY